MKSKQDDVDSYGFSWARQRKINLGITDPEKLEPWERIGQMKSTLAKVKDERIAAGSSTAVNQRFPEVYKGMDLTIHLALHASPGVLRLVGHLQWVWGKLPNKVKAHEVKCSIAQFHIHYTALKSFIRGYLVAVKPGYVAHDDAAGA